MPEEKPRPAPRKKLIEVALPLGAINEESARRKRKSPGGYPTTLHKWWAQRPLAACRAVLFSSLVDDPSSDPQFRKPDGSVDEDRAAEKRAKLFDLIEQLVKWENSTEPKVIDAARAEIARCVASRRIELGDLKKETVVFGPEPLLGKPHAKGPMPGDRETATAYEVQLMRARPEAVNSFLLQYAPPVLDPFAGGGSIPLEAQRLGLRSYASDLNPVPVLITKGLIELPVSFANRPPISPDFKAQNGSSSLQQWRGAAGLAEDIRSYGKIVRDQVQTQLAHLFPKVTVTAAHAKDRPDLKPLVGQSFPVVAWLWARTVPSPDPSAGGAAVPLVRTFTLSAKGYRRAWVFPKLDKAKHQYTFEVGVGTPPAGFDPSKGTVSKKRLNGGRCLLTDAPMDFPYIRRQAKAGKMGIRLMAMAIDAGRGRGYLPPVEEQAAAAAQAKPTWRPDCEFPKKHRNFQPPVYGLDNLGDIFTDRQLVVLDALAQAIRAIRAQIESDARAAGVEDAPGYAVAVVTYLAFALSRATDYNSSLSSWRPKDNAMRSTLAKQALPMVWDFAEGNPFAKSSAGFVDCVNVVAKCLEFVPASGFGRVRQLNATASVNGAQEAVICTDPPYYDNIGYADLSDYLYVWLRRSLVDVHPDLFRTLLTPKAEELIASPHRCDGDHAKAQEFFETGLGSAFSRARERQVADYPMTVFYAFKQAESDEEDGGEDDDSDNGSADSVASTGWEAMLEGLLKAGFAITGTWPMRTEGDNRQIGNDANALASSIVLVCHPRATDAAMASRKEFMGALKRELPTALRDLQIGNIAPVDLAQAAIGPGMAVFSRYSKVLETGGDRMGVRTALALINQILDEVLAEQEGEYDVDTRWAIKWFEQFAHTDGPYGDAETLCKAMAVGINGLVDTGIVVAKGGKVRLLKRAELMDSKPETWDPAEDTDICHWEVCQYLIQRLESGGESAAGNLLRQINARYAGAADVARDLAYRLYTLCERKKWAQDAIAYNTLVVAWPEIQKLAAKGPAAPEGSLYA